MVLSPPRPPQYLHSCRTPAPRPAAAEIFATRRSADSGQQPACNFRANTVQTAAAASRRRPAGGVGQFLLTHTYHHYHIIMITCYHDAQLCAPLSVSCSRVTPHHLLVWLDSTAGTGCSPVAGRWNVASRDCWGAVVQTVDSRYCVETV